MKRGDWVCILSVPNSPAAMLERRMGPGTPGGWVLDRRVDGILYWNEDDMRPATTAEIERAQLEVAQ